MGYGEQMRCQGPVSPPVPPTSPQGGTLCAPEMMLGVLDPRCATHGALEKGHRGPQGCTHTPIPPPGAAESGRARRGREQHREGNTETGIAAPPPAPTSLNTPREQLGAAQPAQGTARHSTVQHGMAWHNMAWCGTAWRIMVQHSMAWHSMAEHSISWYSMAWHSMAWRITVQYGMV